MARLPRYTAPGLTQHVIQRGNDRSPLFLVDSDYEFFRACLREASERHRCAIHAYAFMTNHVHLLMTAVADAAIGKAMQSIGRRYVHHFNTRYVRTGTLWEGRYKATVVDSEAYVVTCYRYIELNPVRAGMVRDPRDYPWSSHRANALGGFDPIVTPHDVYLALGSNETPREAAYRALFDTELSPSTLVAIRDATNKGWALGSDQFRDEIATRLNRRTRRLKAGRPTSASKARL